MRKQLTLAFALLVCLLPPSMAEIPAIDELEGFEIDMEPMWVDFEDADATNPEPLDIEGYFSTEMKALLPNIMGVILKKQENTEGNDSTQVLYTGMAVFQGPPFRTNHEVFTAQAAALTSLQAAASFLHVHNASMGIPQWFDASVLGEQNVKLDEATDGTTTPLLNGTGDNSFSLGSMGVGVAVGFVIGVLAASAAVLCPRAMKVRNKIKAPMSPKHKRKVSNDLPLEQVDTLEDDGSLSIRNSNSFREEFSDEENTIKVPASPNRIKSSTPLKRRPSHHRRWKSTAFHDMQSPNSVMDELGINGPGSEVSSHRRSNSMAGPAGRRPSMVDLLAVDMEELMNDHDEFNDY